MGQHKLHGKRALVTGASSGLGADFARQLALMGCHLVLVARREELLLALKEELSTRHRIDVDVVAMDLSVADAPERLHARLQAENKPIDVLINNAGFGLHGNFLEIPWERERNMLELDILTLVHLTKLFSADMVARDFGYVLQVASIGAYQPTPLYATYAAAKSFVLSFGEALDYELRGTNVRVSVLSPGVTATEFLQNSGQTPTLYQRFAMMDSPSVVKAGLAAMLAGRPSIVPGWLNALTAWSNRLVPRRVSTAFAYQLMR